MQQRRLFCTFVNVINREAQESITVVNRSVGIVILKIFCQQVKSKLESLHQ